MLIADDEEPGRACLRMALADSPDVEIVAECPDGADAVRAIRELGPDVVFLDIEMPGMDGFDVIAEVGAALMPPVILVTAHDSYAVRAFDVGALDYVLKPFPDERIQHALHRARMRLAEGAAGRSERLRAVAEGSPAEERESAREGGKEWVRRFTVRAARDRIQFIPAAAVDWIEADGNYMKLHVGDSVHRIRATLSSLEDALDPSVFVRIHRSTIVNVRRVREVQPWFGGDYLAILEDGQKLKVSRNFRDGLLKPVK